MPGAQATAQLVAPVAACPGHGAQAEAPAPALKVAAGHEAHAVALTEAPYLPAGQRAQAVVPVAEEYLPAAQLEQDVEPAPPAAEYLPAAQLTQLAEEDDDANLPAPHLVHTDAAPAEMEPTAHEAHAVAPAVAAYCPAAQPEQPDEAEAAE